MYRLKDGQAHFKRKLDSEDDGVDGPPKEVRGLSNRTRQLLPAVPMLDDNAYRLPGASKLAKYISRLTPLARMAPDCCLEDAHLSTPANLAPGDYDDGLEQLGWR